MWHRLTNRLLVLLWLTLASIPVPLPPLLPALIPCAHAADVPGNGWDLAQLMAELGKVERLDAVFEERKELAALETPLVSSGFLRYRAPGFLEKEVLQPQHALYRIDGDQVEIDTPDAGQRDFAVDRYPGVRTLVESIRATLAGDETTLTRYFQVRLTGTRQDWTLRLEPMDADVARRIIAINIAGRAERVLRIETLESGSDRTVMTITPTSGAAP